MEDKEEKRFWQKWDSEMSPLSKDELFEKLKIYTRQLRWQIDKSVSLRDRLLKERLEAQIDVLEDLGSEYEELEDAHDKKDTVKSVEWAKCLMNRVVDINCRIATLKKELEAL